MINRNTLIVGGAALALAAAIASAQTSAPDNSKVNSAAINSTGTASTADAQKNDPTDIALTRQIRKSVIADKTLSTYAHNVKIVTVNGMVTLNGVVRDSHEKEVVATKAQAIAGERNVTNELTIAPAN
jgi:hyperosmotically inducible protein